MYRILPLVKVNNLLSYIVLQTESPKLTKVCKGWNRMHCRFPGTCMKFVKVQDDASLSRQYF